MRRDSIAAASTRPSASALAQVSGGSAAIAVEDRALRVGGRELGSHRGHRSLTASRRQLRDGARRAADCARTDSRTHAAAGCAAKRASSASTRAGRGCGLRMSGCSTSTTTASSDAQQRSATENASPDQVAARAHLPRDEVQRRLRAREGALDGGSVGDAVGLRDDRFQRGQRRAIARVRAARARWPREGRAQVVGLLEQHREHRGARSDADFGVEVALDRERALAQRGIRG